MFRRYPPRFSSYVLERTANVLIGKEEISLASPRSVLSAKYRLVLAVLAEMGTRATITIAPLPRRLKFGVFLI